MILVDNSFLSTEEQVEINNYILHNSTWRLNNKTASYREKFPYQSIKTDKTADTFQLNHVLRHEDVVMSSMYDYINNNVFVKFLQKNNIVCNQLIRAKLNLTTISNSDTYQTPHVDQVLDHKVFIYYVNDSDGDTIFFNESYDGEPKDLTIFERVSPQMGTGMVFDGLQYHAATNPKNYPYRCIINIDFI
jgi:hypothetical protein